MAKLEKIQMVRFQREENSKWEVGVKFNDDALLVLDENGQTVNEVWDMKDIWVLSMYLSPLFEGANDYIKQFNGESRVEMTAMERVKMRMAQKGMINT